MGLIDSIRGYLNPDVVNSFNRLNKNNRGALKYFCSGKGWNLSPEMPFGQKKYIIENENQILCDYEEHLKDEERKRVMREVISASTQYPHGFVVLCNKYLNGVLGESVRMPGQVKSKRARAMCKTSLLHSTYGINRIKGMVYNGQYAHFSYGAHYISNVADLQTDEIALLHIHLQELKSEEETIVAILAREDLINKFEDEVLDHFKRVKYYEQFVSSISGVTDKQIYCANHLAELDHFIGTFIPTEYNRIKAKYPLGAAYIDKNVDPCGGLSKEETLIKYEERAAVYEVAIQKYEVLKQKYPVGLPAFEAANSYDDGKNSAFLKIQKIVKCEEQIREYEVRERKVRFGDRIEKVQKEFSVKCRNLRNSVFENLGCYDYDIHFSKMKENGEITDGKFPVWQFFCHSYSKDDSIDLKYYPNKIEQKETRTKLINKELFFKDHIYDKIFNFINQIKQEFTTNEVYVLFANSGKKYYENINNFHFQYLLLKLDENNIKHASLNKLLEVSTSKTCYIILELDSVNSRLKKNCSELLEMTINNFEQTDMSILYECRIVYISMSKGLDREEMLLLNKQTEIEIALSEEIRKKKKEEEERKRREEQEKAEKITTAKAIASTYGLIFKKFFPDVAMYSITLQEAEQIIASESKMLNYRDFCKRVQNVVSGWGEIKGIPYYHFYHYYPTRFTDVTPESRNVREMIYNFKDGIANTRVVQIMTEKLQSTFTSSDLQKLTLVCIPASTIEDNIERYSSFSKKLCENTGMRNGFSHITIIREKTQSHLGGTDSAEYSYDSDFFKDARIILFDDVVTRGRSMSQMQAALQRIGATVICAMSIGRTYSDYYGDNRRPHPWTGDF